MAQTLAFTVIFLLKHFGTRLQGRIILQEEQVVWESQVLSSEQICLWFVVCSQVTECLVLGEAGHPRLCWLQRKHCLVPWNKKSLTDWILWCLQWKDVISHTYLHGLLCHFTGIHTALSDVATVKETTVTPLCSSQCWCSTKPWLWGVAQIFLYNSAGTSASWSLVFDRADFLQVSWLVIYTAFL